jgi:hypothetical protein
MKWYKKQLEALLKKTEEKDSSKKIDQKKTGKPGQLNALRGQNRKSSFASPVAQRNRNRDKTDLY